LLFEGVPAKKGDARATLFSFAQKPRSFPGFEGEDGERQGAIEAPFLVEWGPDTISKPARRRRRK